MAIEWDSLIVEMVFLSAIIFFSVYLEQWIFNRSQRNEDEKTRKNLLKHVKEDLHHKLKFINESIMYKDYKPFFTDVWDGVIFTGKQSLLSFDIFQTIQRTYSWMKYYNSELEINKSKNYDEKIFIELLNETNKSIKKTLEKLE